MSNKNIDYMNKDTMMKAINEATDYILSKIDKKPEIALVLGSGLGAFAENLQDAQIFNYEDIPNFPRPTVLGHGGKLFIGNIAGKCVVVMQGRNHYYEGFDTQTITLPIRIFAKMGVKSVVLTNACGGVNKHFKPGQLMIIEDHLSHFCPSPLRGAYLDEFGPRFTDMSRAYDHKYIEYAEESAKELNLKVQKGVYGYWPGPCYESPAEVRAYMALGADVVGMSTVAECAVAVNSGMKVLGISCVTNMTCIWSKSVTSHEEVMEMGLKVADDFIKLLTKTLEKM